jgi:hypothetical protein
MILHTFFMGLCLYLLGKFKIGFIENVYSQSCMTAYIFISSIMVAI